MNKTYTSFTDNAMHTKLVIVFLMVSALAATAFGATLTVSNSGPADYSSIQAAIDASANGDEIIVGEGTYVENINFVGKGIIVRSGNIADPTDPVIYASTTIIDGGQAGSVVTFASGETNSSVLKGFKITNGSASYGGGIECEGASPLIESCIITGNTAWDGGAIDCVFDAGPIIKDCEIYGNTADTDGGGAIEIYSCMSVAPVITNCLIYGNSAPYRGGAIDVYDSSNVVIEHCTIADNVVTSGIGAVYANDASSNIALNYSILWNNGDYDISGAAINVSNCILQSDNPAGADPAFTSGPLGDYYLSQTAAYQLDDSSAVNLGDQMASGFFDAAYTTATNNIADANEIDLGYHYPALTTNYYTLEALVVGANGTISPDHTLPVSYPEFAQVKLDAIPDAGFQVLEWNDGAITSAGQSYLAMMDSNKTVTVEFAPLPQYTLTTSVSEGSGIITPDTGVHYAGVVTVQATADAEWGVLSWEGVLPEEYDMSDPSVVHIDLQSDREVSVKFAPDVVRLNIRVINGNGTVTPKRLNVLRGQQVELYAQPDFGYKVKQWVGTDFDEETLRTNYVTAEESKTVSVEFEPAELFTLDVFVVSDGDGDFGSVNVFREDGSPADPNSYLAYEGEIVSLQALPDPNYLVRQWSGTDNDYIIDPNNTVTIQPGYNMVTVNFDPNSSPDGSIYLKSDPSILYGSIQEAIDAISGGAELDPNTMSDATRAVLIEAGLPMAPEDPNSNMSPAELMAAIEEAGVTIDTVMVADGYYYDPNDFNLDYYGWPITVKSENGPKNCIIDTGGEAAVVFDSAETSLSVYEGFTVYNGGIEISGNAKPIVRNCSFMYGGISISNNIPDDYEFDDEVGVDDPNLVKPLITDCQLRYGGISIVKSTAIITNTEIYGAGSGIACTEGSQPEIVNCLITNCRTGISIDKSQPYIHLCTIADNSDGIIAKEAELAQDEVRVTNSILWNYSDDLDGYNVSFCLIQDFDAGNGVIHALEPGFASGMRGDYYLQRYDYTNNLDASPALNAGQGGQRYFEILNKYSISHDVTTDIFGWPDCSYDYDTIDLGYHYKPWEGTKLSTLHVEVLDPFGKVHVSRNESIVVDYRYVDIEKDYGFVEYGDPQTFYMDISDYEGDYYYYSSYEIPTIDLRAVADDGFRLNEWTGTDDDYTYSSFNTVTLSSLSRGVTASFELIHERTIHVPGDYPNIQQAIDEAKNDDTIVIAPGFYKLSLPDKELQYSTTLPNVDGFLIYGKNITITSEDPSDPEVVASTIIDGEDEVGPAFTVISADGGHSTIMGLTIQNVHWYHIDQPSQPQTIPSGYDGYDGEFQSGGAAFELQGNHIVAHCVIKDCSVEGGDGGPGKAGSIGTNNPGNLPTGGDGGAGGDLHGGAISIYSGSPQILNCSFENCEAIGGNGANGSIGAENDEASGLSQGGRGGAGGRAFGGGIYIYLSGRPVIKGCTFDGCRAEAGNGGDGGPGGNDSSGGAGGIPGYAEGGAIFVSAQSPYRYSYYSYYDYGNTGIDTSITIEDCTITNSTAVGGQGGDGGVRAGTARGSYGGGTYVDSAQGDVRRYTSKGGGIGIDSFTKATLKNCVIEGNSVIGSISGIGTESSGSNYQWQPRLNYQLPGLGGGVYCASNSNVTIEESEITRNITTFDAANLTNPLYFLGKQSAGYGGGLCVDGFYYYNGFGYDEDDYYYYPGDEPQVTKNVINFKMFNSHVAENIAPVGGGIYSAWMKDSEITDCNIVENISDLGGGMFATSTLNGVMDNVLVSRNIANPRNVMLPATTPDGDGTSSVNGITFRDGYGGGMYIITSDMTIRNSEISQNRSTGMGGGGYFAGSENSLVEDGATTYIPAVPKLQNCLVVNNTALKAGGGIANNWHVHSIVENCTIVGNTVTAENGFGGGIYSIHDSNSLVANSILWENKAANGPQIAVSGGSPMLPFPSNFELKYSDVQGYSDPNFSVSVDDTSTLNAEGIIDADPLFVDGYHLSNKLALQDANSPCIDAGDPLTTDLLNDPNRTTRTDGVVDTNIVDLGYHYNHKQVFNLTVNVIGGNGVAYILKDHLGGVYNVEQGQFNYGAVVTVKAEPAAGYRVRKWEGTDDPNSTWGEITAVVTMKADAEITVRFEPDVTRKILVPQNYSTLEEAFEAAGSGDEIIIEPGTYTIDNPDGINLYSKKLKIVSAGPDDPNYINNTIIDLRSQGRAFVFSREGSSESSIIGLTFINGLTVGNLEVEGGSAYGGAILCENGSSPLIKNCRFINNRVVGAKGEDALAGDDAPVGSGDPGDRGADALPIESSGCGGAIACIDKSSPKIENCYFEGNTARSGDGGNGGAGGSGDGTASDGYGGSGGNVLGDGLGGALFADNGSMPVLMNCEFASNSVARGVPGFAGTSGDNVVDPNSIADPDDGSVVVEGPVVGVDGIVDPNSNLYGGGVYYGVESDAVIIDCTFTGNSAEAGSGVFSDSNNVVKINASYFIENNGTAVFVDPNCFVTINDSNFIGNSSESAAGALYVSEYGVSDVNECDFFDNASAGSGGAVYVAPFAAFNAIRCDLAGNRSGQNGGAVSILSDASIVDCNFVGNIASGDGGSLSAERYIDLEAQAEAYEAGLEYMPEAIDIIITGTRFVDSQGVYGGALYFYDPNTAKITDCNVASNMAQSGGGIYAEFGNISIDKSNIVNNKAEDNYAIGGGIAAMNASAMINDTKIQNNTVAGTNSLGGGVCFYEGYGLEYSIKNCLITGNDAGKRGGGISCAWFVDANIANSTIADNEVAGLAGITDGYGGGVSASYSSNILIEGSIVWGNISANGAQVSASGDLGHESSIDITNTSIDLEEGKSTVDFVDPDAAIIRPGFNQFTLPANDDESTAPVSIGFEANFFNVTRSELFVNNNGNVTFDFPLWTFTPFGLQENLGTAIIAPFFADVDTRGDGSSVVTYGYSEIDGHKAFGVNWLDVGYFSRNDDKLNSFQLILIDRSDRAPGDFDIEFNNERILWETGDFSGGDNGFGGTSASVGYSNGTGVPGTFFEFEGSRVNGALLDGNNDTGLTANSSNSQTLGRYIFSVQSGRPGGLASGPPVYAEGASAVTGVSSSVDDSWDISGDNVEADPNFIGNYFLSQKMAGQLIDSQCIDLLDSSDPKNALYYDNVNYTTCTNALSDVDGMVDLGFHHYRYEPKICNVYIEVIGEGGSVSISGFADPNEVAANGEGSYFVNEYVSLNIEAQAENDYRVRKWYGTDDEITWFDTEQTVFIDGDRRIAVEFEQDIANTRLVPSEYATIAQAVAEASPGDEILVEPGLHRISDEDARGIDFEGKALTLMSTAPNDPNIVAQTIIDCQANTIDRKRAFWFHNGEGPDTRVMGFTIINAIYSGKGGAILCENGSSPTLAYLVFRNCIASGAGRGGAIAAYENSNPLIYNCEFIANIAENGLGGAIYCDQGSSPLIQKCVFTENEALRLSGYAIDNPDVRYTAGGAIYYGVDCDARIYDSVFTGNASYSTSYDFVWYDWNLENSDTTNPDNNEMIKTHDFDYEPGSWRDFPISMVTFTDGGAICSEPNNIIDIANCDFTSNYGGAVFADPNCEINVADSLFKDNSGARKGGAIYLAQGAFINVNNCNFEGNDSVGEGGAISTLADLTIADCNLVSNIAGGPGGALNVLADLSVTDCNFVGNEASGDGGAINAQMFIDEEALIDGGIIESLEVSITGTRFTENRGDWGGAIYMYDPNNAVIADCNMVANTSNSGGGLYTEFGSVSITSTEVQDNIANGPHAIGGGLAFMATAAVLEDCQIQRNEVRGSFSLGGGISFHHGRELDKMIKNCLISDNKSGLRGGGISFDWTGMNSTNEILNSTIANNVSTSVYARGGGLALAYDCNVKLKDSIVWGNNAAQGAQLSVSGGPAGNDDPDSIESKTKLYPSALEIIYSDVQTKRYSSFELPDTNVSSSLSTESTEAATVVSPDKIQSQFDEGADTVKMIVTLRKSDTSVNWQSPESVDQYRQTISQLQTSFLAKFTADELTVRYVYDNQPSFSAEVTAAGLDKLKADSQVAFIETVEMMYPALAQSLPLANAMATRAEYDGSGISIAIVDTGIDYRHPMLGNGGFPNDKVIGGYDTGMNDPDPMPLTQAHGTNCAGNAAGNITIEGDYIGGVAPGAKLYALKANPDGIGGFMTDAIIAAWDWCITHQNDDPDNPIMVISNSLGSGHTNDPREAERLRPGMALATENANAVGITVLAASGNNGFTDGISSLAALPRIISVGAVYDMTDQVTGYSNTGTILDIHAPADPMYTTDIIGDGGYWPGDYFPYFNGTSSACPFAAGAVAVLQSAAMEKMGYYLSPEQIRDILVTTGDPVTDTKVAITKPRVNLGNALNALGFAGPPIYVEEGSTLAGFDPNELVDPNELHWDPIFPNISADPNFVGNYFLSHIASGQLSNSPCIDAGDPAVTDYINDPNYTTRSDGTEDTDVLDMGYHNAPIERGWFHVDFELIYDANFFDEPPIMTSDPNENEGWYNELDQVKFTISDVPVGFRVKWSGTDHDFKTGAVNSVTVDEHEFIRAEIIKDSYRLTIRTTGNGEFYTKVETEGVESADENNPLQEWKSGVIYHDYAYGTKVNLYTEPNQLTNPVNRVARWYGTNNDPNWFDKNDPTKNWFNSVTITGDMEVKIEFEPDVVTSHLVPSEFSTIQKAINAASPGDRVVVAPGVHLIDNPRGINFGGKAVTLMSENPNDPYVVASTVINCRGTQLNPKRAFHFYKGEDPNTVISGITIKNAFYLKRVPNSFRYDYDDEGNLILIPDGEDAEFSDGSNVYGGAILCENGSSPSFINCVIKDNTVAATRGGDGVSFGGDPDGDSLTGGRGGYGFGIGFGGAMACLDNSNPVLTNCTFENNVAMGGIGGEGGHGDDGDNGFGGSGGLAFGAGMGGAIYCGTNSMPEFYNCTFIGNAAKPGLPGRGGLAGGHDDTVDGIVGHREISQFVSGGAIYIDESESNLVISDCKFIENEAYDIIGDYFYDAEWDTFSEKIYTRGAAIYSDPNTNLKVSNCQFEGNLGGALFFGDNCYVTVKNCDFIDNYGFDEEDSIKFNGVYDTYDSYYGYGYGDYYGYYGYYTYYGYDWWYWDWYWYGFEDTKIYDLISVIPENTCAGAIQLGNAGQLVLEDSLFKGNASSHDGGAVRSYSDAEVTNCRFVSNKSATTGGALMVARVEDPNYPHVNVTFNDCAFARNSAKGIIKGANFSRDDYYYYDYNYDYYYDYEDLPDPITQSLGGGAVMLRHHISEFNDCYFTGNNSTRGGALVLVSGESAIRNGYFADNIALASDAKGGALMNFITAIEIENTIMQNNSAPGKDASGGAISFYAGNEAVKQSIVNSLLTGNHAGDHGGAVSCLISIHPEIRNVTFSDNTAGTSGSAISCDWDSIATISDSIFNNNNNKAIVFENGVENIDINHSIFYANSDGDICDCRQGSGEVVNIDPVAFDATNIAADPNFVKGIVGNYYLDQDVSPAIGAASGLPYTSGIDLSKLTTDPNHVILDAEADDIGYHYNTEDPADPTSKFSMQVVVVPDGAGNIHGTVEIEPLEYQPGGIYIAGTPVKLTAKPVPGYRVSRWSGGTVDDTSDAIENVVIVNKDKVIRVEFDQPKVLVVGSSSEYTTIQRTIEAAKDGDTVIIPRGEYRPVFPYNSLYVVNRDITITGAYSDSPDSAKDTRLIEYVINVVNSNLTLEAITVESGNMRLHSSAGKINNCDFVNCNDQYYYDSGIWLYTDSYSNSGGAIAMYQSDFDITNTDFINCGVRGYNGATLISAGGDGFDGGNALGGAISIYSSSPRIENCTFEDCYVVGGDGGNGNNGWDTHSPDGIHQGGEGGWAGRAYGGAIFATTGSHPVFKNCVFTDCFAQGGNGGDGGEGFFGYPGGRGGNWTWSDKIEESTDILPEDGWGFGYTFYELYGPLSEYGDTGYSYLGWWLESKTDFYDPALYWSQSNWDTYYYNYSEYEHPDLGSPFDHGWVKDDYYGYTGIYDEPWKYSGYGGAFYAQTNSSAKFENCKFNSNKSYGGLSGTGGVGGYPQRPDRPIKLEAFGGAVYSGPGCNLDFKECEFTHNLSDNVSVATVTTGTGDDEVTTIVSTDNDDPYVSFGGAVASEENENVNFLDCVLTGNSSSLGGAFYWYKTNADITGSEFTLNSAYHGGGLYSVESTGSIASSRISSNTAQFKKISSTSGDTTTYRVFGQGGGLFCLSSPIDILDSEFVGNEATSSGGGIYLGGSDLMSAYTPDLTNILFEGNISGRDGGAVSANWYAEPYISNCNFIDNTATGETTADKIGHGGAVTANYNSNVTIKNSIFMNNKAGSNDASPRIEHLYLGNPSYGAGLKVTYSDVVGTPFSVFAETFGALEDPETESASIDNLTWNSNIDENPIFVEGLLGSYYLSSDPNNPSPCINAGDNNVKFDITKYTTSIDSIGDMDGQVDIGMYYVYKELDFANAPRHNLNISLDGGQAEWSVEIIGLNTIITGSPSVVEIPEGAYVLIKVVPLGDYILTGWQGTDNDQTVDLTNRIQMGLEDMNVVIRLSMPRTINVPSDFSNLDDAIAFAKRGDIIKLASDPLPYVSTGIVFDKDITITSSNPDEPTVVDTTIIEIIGTDVDNPYGVYFAGNTTSGAVLNGITLQGRVYTGQDGAPGDESNPDGGDGESLEGAGIYVESGSSASIRNCVITGFHLIAGNGGAGADASETGYAGRGGWGGYARGAGVFVATGASPKFTNCKITECSATGGSGGDGGNSSEANPESAGYGGLWNSDITQYTSWRNWGYEGPFRLYSGYGGGVYCDQGSSPTFIACTITENFTQGGTSGVGGQITETVGVEPLESYEVPSYGGGIYLAANSEAMFRDCTISKNYVTTMDFGDGTPDDATDDGTGGTDDGTGGTDDETDDTAITTVYGYGYGGGIAFEGYESLTNTTKVTFENCLIKQNEASSGGGIYWRNAQASLDGCLITLNKSYHGAGIFATRGETRISNCDISTNQAGIFDGLLTNVVIADPDADDTTGDGTTDGDGTTGDGTTDDGTDDGTGVVAPEIGDLGGISGQGGGIHCESITALIEDCYIYNNNASASGGGIFMAGSETGASIVRNCLISSNTSGRDGGGISANWFSLVTVENSTIVGNNVTSSGFEQINPDTYQIVQTGFGGAIYTGYHSKAQIWDSILTDNSAVNGRQIAVGSGFQYDPRGSEVKVRYSAVKGGNDGNASYVDDNTICTLDWFEGTLDTNIRLTSDNTAGFVTGPQNAAKSPHYHMYYLNQATSPCVDAGSDMAYKLGFEKYTTDPVVTFDSFDTGIVDIGYHYKHPFAYELHECRQWDYQFDGQITVADMALFAQWWLASCDPDSTESEYLACSARDYNEDNSVDFIDFAHFAGCWGYIDTEPPTPNKSEWAKGGKPAQLSINLNNPDTTQAQIDAWTTSLTMSAEPASDAWWGNMVWYYFICHTNPAFDSGWQRSPDYNPTGLEPGKSYTFSVMVKDGMIPANITDPSVQASAETGIEKAPPAVEGPIVNDVETIIERAEWEFILITEDVDGVINQTIEYTGYPQPSAIYGDPYVTITMSAQPAIPVTGRTIVYKFERYNPDTSIIGETNPLAESGWITSSTWTDGNEATTPLTPGATYRYVVKMSYLGYTDDPEYVSDYSDAFDVIAEFLPALDTTPPPSPAFDQPVVQTICSQANYDSGGCPEVGTWHTLSCGPVEDPEGTTVMYYFWDVNNPGVNSGWTTETTWQRRIPGSGSYHYKVKAKDASGNISPEPWDSVSFYP